MEGILLKGAETLGAQGTGWLLFVMACCFSLWQLRRNDVCQEVIRALLEQSLEARAETREGLKDAIRASEATTLTLERLRQSFDGQAAAFTQMASTFDLRNKFEDERRSQEARK